MHSMRQTSMPVNQLNEKQLPCVTKNVVTQGSLALTRFRRVAFRAAQRLLAAAALSSAVSGCARFSLGFAVTFAVRFCVVIALCWLAPESRFYFLSLLKTISTAGSSLKAGRSEGGRPLTLFKYSTRGLCSASGAGFSRLTSRMGGFHPSVLLRRNAQLSVFFTVRSTLSTSMRQKRKGGLSRVTREELEKTQPWQLGQHDTELHEWGSCAN